MSIREQSVFSGGRSKPFGELTREEVSARAAELRSVGGSGGPTARVMPVAMAWAELARTMASQGAESVSDLDEPTLEARAQRLWIVPPGGSLLP
jgi:hypothetical protein